MPFSIQPVTADDLRDGADVQAAAFGATSNIHHTIYPNGDTEYAKADSLKSMRETFADANATCLKVVDPDNNGKMVAWINWETIQKDEPMTSQKQDSASPPEAKHPDKNTDFCNVFFGGLAKLKKDNIKDNAYVRIGVLVTHPEYHRRGLGKMLLDRCAEHADKLKLSTYLEASPLAAPLYLREGFVAIEGAVLDIDMKPYGFDELHRTVMMVRPVGGKQH